MIYLALSVVCSLALANVFKHAERRNHDRFGVIATNYAVGILIALLLLGVQGRAGDVLRMQVAPDFLGLAMLEGVLFVGGLFMLTLATRYAGISISVGVQRTSVIIPFTASWLVFGEVPTPFQFAGLAVGAAAFFLIARRPGWPVPTVIENEFFHGAGQGTPRVLTTVFVLFLLFLVGGSVDFVFKVFDELFAAAHGRTTFLLLVFLTAFILCSIMLLWRRIRYGRWPRRAALGWGVVVGLANYGAAQFLLLAVSELSGPLVFPANNVSIVIGGALIGVLFWREHLSPLNWAGLACAGIALVLLSL